MPGWKPPVARFAFTRRAKTLWVVLGALAVALFIYNDFTVYVGPNEAAIEQVQVGASAGIKPGVLHTGLPNRGAALRPILYMVYARTWFHDEINHLGRPSLDMSPEQYAALSPSGRTRRATPARPGRRGRGRAVSRSW